MIRARTLAKVLVAILVLEVIAIAMLVALLLR